MKLLISLKNRINIIYRQHSLIISFLMRLVFALVSLLILRGQTNYNQFLSNTWFVIVFSVVCAFIPVRIMTVIILAYVDVQFFTLSAAIGGFAAIIFLIAWLLYFKLEPSFGYALILIPLCCIIRMPLLIPLVLALTAPSGSFIAVLFGFVVNYIIRYINNNNAVFAGMSDVSELSKMSVLINGFFSYREFLYTTAIILIVFFLVFFLKKINSRHSFAIAASIGSAIYVILIISANLIFGTMTTQRLLYLIFGSIIALILALIIAGTVLPLDHSRTEFLEFEDEEYYYYVRAVPKVTIDRGRVSVKRISRRDRDHSIEFDITSGEDQP